MMGQDYAALKIVDMGDGKFRLQRVNCKKCLKDGKEEVEAEVEIDGVKGDEPYTVKYASVGVGQVKPSARITTPDLWLRVKVRGHRPKGKVVPQTLCRFYYSLDGKNYKELGSEFAAQPGKWIGAKVGLFNCRPGTKNDAAWLDVDSFIFTK